MAQLTDGNMMSDLKQNATHDSLTQREIEILLLISEGKSNQEICEHKFHLQVITCLF